MTGTELFEALSFVDERYIQEAEIARLSGKIPWIKILSVAACLCILITGVLALENLGLKGSMEEAAPEAAAPEAAPEATPEAAPEAAPLAPEEEIFSESVAEEAPTPGELEQIPYAALRIVGLLEDGSFEAIVEEITGEPVQFFEVGMQVKLTVDPAKVPGADREIQNDLSKILAGVQIEIENGAYDVTQNILYVAEVFFDEVE